jgi:hypothetical protein
MDYLADYVYAGAGCEDKQQQVIITFRPTAVLITYLKTFPPPSALQYNFLDLISVIKPTEQNLF